VTRVLDTIRDPTSVGIQVTTTPALASRWRRSTVPIDQILKNAIWRCMLQIRRTPDYRSLNPKWSAGKSTPHLGNGSAPGDIGRRLRGFTTSPASVFKITKLHSGEALLRCGIRTRHDPAASSFYCGRDGLINQLGEWVLRRPARRPDLPDHIKLAVNVSPVHQERHPA